MKKRTVFVLGVLVFLSAMTGTGFAGQIIYVDTDAPAGGDGESWETAFNYLQDGLAAAEDGDEIWVAEGTYTPDTELPIPAAAVTVKRRFSSKMAWLSGAAMPATANQTPMSETQIRTKPSSAAIC